MDPQELGFTPQRPVGWLAPLLLLSTGLRTLLAILFGAYLDKRELQNALAGDVVRPARHRDGELWLDYVADLGDGFDATYSVAYLLAQPRARGRRRGAAPRPAAADGRRPGLSAGQRRRLREPHEGPVPRGPAGGAGRRAAAHAVRAARQPRLVRRAHRVPAPVRPAQGRPHRRLAHPAAPVVLRGRSCRRTGGCSRSTSSSGRTSTTRSCSTSRRPRSTLGPDDRIILMTPSPTWVKARRRPGGVRRGRLLHPHDPGADRGARAGARLRRPAPLRPLHRRRTGELITCGGGGAYLLATHTAARASSPCRRRRR